MRNIHSLSYFNFRVLLGHPTGHHINHQNNSQKFFIVRLCTSFSLTVVKVKELRVGDVEASTPARGLG